MGDPRVMQAVVSLQGMAMDITSQDMDLAEQEGHARSAPAVTVEERQLAQAAVRGASFLNEGMNSSKEFVWFSAPLTVGMAVDIDSDLA